MDYYHRFLEEFPDLESLAKAEEAVVLKVWEGLGYYSRARNMHSAAKTIFHNLDGIFPASFNELMKMKGVGPYTAAAISSMAFNEPRAAVDGNVHRVLSRLFGIEEPAGSYTASSHILKAASDILDEGDPGTHNQAVMELGAMICTPTRPACSSCPLQNDCIAFQQDRILDLPVKSKQIKRRKRYFHYLYISDEEGIWLRRRQEKDIWEGLYEFPLIETSRPYSAESLYGTGGWSALFADKQNPVLVSGQIVGPVKHVLSHQDIFAKFYTIDEPLEFRPEGYEKVKLDQLDRFPLPKLITKYLYNQIYIRPT